MKNYKNNEKYYVEVQKYDQKINGLNIDKKDYFDHRMINNRNVELKNRNIVSRQGDRNIDNSRIGINAQPGNLPSPHQNFLVCNSRQKINRINGEQLNNSATSRKVYDVRNINLDKDHKPFPISVNAREQELQQNYNQRTYQKYEVQNGDYSSGYLDYDGNFIIEEVSNIQNKNDYVVIYRDDQNNNQQQNNQQNQQQNNNQQNQPSDQIPSITPFNSNKNCTAGSFPDCAGVCTPAGQKSKHLFDCLGNCYEVGVQQPKATLDCMGKCIKIGEKGATTDCAGVCTPYGEKPTHEQDCAGNCYNVHTEKPKSDPDCLGHCNPVGEGAVPGCNAVCGSNWTIDCLGNCVAPGTGAIIDCNGECNGRATLDCNGTCTKFGDAPKYLTDCSGQCYLATLRPPHIRDCSGACVVAGQETAYFDRCGHCVKKGDRCNCDKSRDSPSSSSSSSSSSSESRHKHHHKHKAHEFRQEVNSSRIIRRFANKNE